METETLIKHLSKFSRNDKYHKSKSICKSSLFSPAGFIRNIIIIGCMFLFTAYILVSYNNHSIKYQTITTSIKPDISTMSDNILPWLYPTESMSIFNFTKYLSMAELGGSKYFFDRTLSVYPGNAGPILQLFFDKLILNESTCLNIGVLGGSVSKGIIWDVDLNKNTEKDKERYAYYLELWLNEMFENDFCNHTVYYIGFGGSSVGSFIGGVFSEIFFSPNSIKYDIVIVEAATNNHVKRDNADEIRKELELFEIYFRHLLQIPYHPVIINLEATIHRGATGHILASHFIMTSILKYYQIVSLSLYDSLQILQKTYKTNIGNDELKDVGYFSHEGTHPFFWGHQILSTMISYYLFLEYNKIVTYYTEQNNDIQLTRQWIKKHYLYPVKPLILPSPPLYISAGDVEKYELMNYINDIVIFYSFDLKHINYKHYETEKENKMMEAKINKYLLDLTASNIVISNIRNIPFCFNSVNVDYDSNLANSWHFGIESEYRKPGIIFYSKPNVYNTYNESVLIIKLDLSNNTEIKGIRIKRDEDTHLHQRKKHCQLKMNYLQSYERMSVATYIWMNDKIYIDSDNNFECNLDFIQSINNKVIPPAIINALNANDKTSQIYEYSMDIMNPMQLYPIQYLNVCVHINETLNSKTYENKFKLTSIAVQCNIVV